MSGTWHLALALMVLRSLPRWSPAYREKMAYATAYFITDAQVTGRCLQTLLRDVVVKDGKFNSFLMRHFFQLNVPSVQ